MLNSNRNENFPQLLLHIDMWIWSQFCIFFFSECKICKSENKFLNILEFYGKSTRKVKLYNK